MNSLVFPAPAVPTIPVAGSSAHFPIHRIYCVGRNYVEHAQEMGFTGREAPFFFLKPADVALVVPEGQTGQMAYPALTDDLHHEVELVIALGKGGKNIAEQDALEHVYGYAVGLDMTRRDRQAEMKKQGRPWCIGKAFEQSAPIGPITPQAQAGDVTQADIALRVNGEVRQQGNTRDLIWKMAEIIAQLSQAWELVSGDLIYTGTPAGVGAVNRGDTLQASVQGLTPVQLIIR